jgi:tartrate-resistant acid phosphatase type 5
MDRRRFIISIPALLLSTRKLIASKGCTVSNAPASMPMQVEKGASWNVKMAVLGDWGTGGSLQRKVANSILLQHNLLGGYDAVVSTGDNFYPSGVQSAEDLQWTSKFRRIYSKELLEIPWVAVLGNHDYRGSTEAQIAYAKHNDNWIMPANYYTHVIGSDPSHAVTIVSVDTQQLLTRSTGWQDQIAWFQKELSEIKTRWKIVVGHHPARSYGHYGDQDWLLKMIKPHMDQYGVQAYLCGHDHDLQFIKHPTDVFHCVVSGAGGGCRSTSFGKYSLAAGTNGGFVSWLSNSKQAMIQMINDESTVTASILIEA